MPTNVPDCHYRPTRRAAIAASLGAAAAGLVTAKPTDAQSAPSVEPTWKVANGRINQSVCAWCFKDVPFDTLCQQTVAMGLRSIELLPPERFPEIQKHGLICAMTSGHGFVRGWNHLENHDFCIEKTTRSIEANAAAGFPNVITFSGMRKGMSDEEGIRNTVAGIKKVIGLAERSKVTLCFEVLNSRVDVEMKGHPDYQGDRLEWAVEVCDKVGSERLKILFDIYHIQIMEGDIITRIKQYKDYIGHYHTAGVPGRNELDDAQEINYPPIMRAIAETGYKGFVGQEFIPRSPDHLASLRAAVKLCDV